MILGGGPHRTTLSLALYQSLFFFYDPAQGFNYAGLQLLLSLGLAVGTVLFKSLPHGSSLKMPALPFLKSNFQKPLVIFSLFLILAPLVVVAGFSFFSLPKTLSNPMLWQALSRSFLISLSVGPLSLLLTLIFVKYESLFSKSLTSLYLLFPPALLGFFFVLYLPGMGFFSTRGFSFPDAIFHCAAFFFASFKGTLSNSSNDLLSHFS
ncbi:hypothetical protein QM565_32695 [Geitlerinema splendidum]|nr:hypothetical protein [Geitlerinema splendidum]